MGIGRVEGAAVLAALVLIGGAASAPAAQWVQPALDFDVTHEVVGRHGGRLRVALSLAVKSDGIGRSAVGGVEVAQFAVRGEVTRELVVLEAFEYAFTVPVENGQIPIVVERELRPGEYDVRLELRDLTSGRRGERVVALAVAVPSTLLSPAAEHAVEENGSVRRILLAGPPGEALSGLQVFTAAVTGEVSKVEFLLNGELVLTRNRPPFRAQIDLGLLPRATTVTAVARDSAGSEVDRSQIVVNQGRERFVVRLEPITPADRRDGEVLVRAAVNAPPERRVERVEFYLDEARVKEVPVPPFEAWIRLDSGAGLMRAVATLDDGAQGEDFTLLNGASFSSGVRVDAVELPVTVLGEGGKPVEDLTRDDFEVFEDGVPQRVTHFARHRDVPVRVGLVVDASGSMETTLPEVQRVALGFLRNLLRPTDRAFVAAFSDRPVLLESMTRDFDALGRSLLALRAERWTALYDAIVFSLFQFSGVRGRRALVVLTDGADNASRHTFEQVIELASRTGATVYAIGVDISVRELRARAGLQRLARATGGEAFFIARAGGLERVYARIERELRSQYLIAYTSSSQSPPGTLRSIEVRVGRPRVEVRTLAGYVPE